MGQAPERICHSRLLIGLAAALLLGGCTAVREPYSLAPFCATDKWCPTELPGKPVEDVPLDPAGCLDPVIPDSDTPLSLPQLVDIALQNSYLTRQTWAAARVAATQYASELSAFYPDIAFQGTYERQKTPYTSATSSLATSTNQVFNSFLTTYGPQITLSFLIYDCGATLANAAALQQALFSANWTHNREIQTVVQTILNDYYTYLNGKGQVAANEANLKDSQVNLEAAIMKRTSGIFDMSDELQAKTQLAQAELNLLSSQQTMQDSLAQLINDAGLAANIRLTVDDLPSDFSYETISRTVDDLLKEAYHIRPDVLSAKATLLSNAESIRQAERTMLPALNFTGDLGKTYFGHGLSDDNDWTATLTLSMPLFRGWYYRNQVKQAKASYEQSKAILLQLKNTVALQVVQSYQNFIIAAQMIKASKGYVSAAEKFYKASLQKYRAGTTDFTTLVSAMASLATARSSLVSSKAAWFTALVNLAYATGTLGPTAVIEPSTMLNYEDFP